MRHQQCFFGGVTLIVMTTIAIGCSVDPAPTDDTRSSSSATEARSSGAKDENSGAPIKPQSECGGLGASCEINGDCCDRDCSANGVCGHPSGGECKGRGAHCQMNGDCCSMDCHFGGIPTPAGGRCR